MLASDTWSDTFCDCPYILRIIAVHMFCSELENAVE